MLLLQFRDNDIILASSTNPEISFMGYLSLSMGPLLPNSGLGAWDS